MKIPQIKKPLPPFLTFDERNKLMLAPLTHFNFLCSGQGTAVHLQAIAGLMNLGMVAAYTKRDETKENIFMEAQSCLLTAADRAEPEKPLVLTEEERAYLAHALKVMDSWLMTLPRSRLKHAAQHIEYYANEAETPKPKPPRYEQ